MEIIQRHGSLEAGKSYPLSGYQTGKVAIGRPFLEKFAFSASFWISLTPLNHAYGHEVRYRRKDFDSNLTQLNLANTWVYPPKDLRIFLSYHDSR